MLSNYFSYPGVSMRPTLPMAGLGSTGGSGSSLFGGLAWFAINAGCGYYIGQYFKKPVAGAALSALLGGLPGLVVLALISDKPATAIANRRRRRHHRRRGFGRRAGGWR